MSPSASYRTINPARSNAPNTSLKFSSSNGNTLALIALGRQRNRPSRSATVNNMHHANRIGSPVSISRSNKPSWAASSGLTVRILAITSDPRPTAPSDRHSVRKPTDDIQVDAQTAYWRKLGLTLVRREKSLACLHNRSSLVLLLFAASSPSAISGLIVAIVVRKSVYRVIRSRTASHVRQKSSEGRLPSLTNVDAASAVVVVSLMTRVIASELHLLPAHVLWRGLTIFERTTVDSSHCT